jgi:hypothetical protein
MSEYQYYEFQAIDRPLTKKEMATLRTYSTRARITATSFESEGWLASLISVRAELARGDLRALYLGWLLCAQCADLNPAEVSPPVPAGLAKLSASLTSLVGFLRIDKDLVRVAAKRTAKRRTVAVRAAGNLTDCLTALVY